MENEKDQLPRRHQGSGFDYEGIVLKGKKHEGIHRDYCDRTNKENTRGQRRIL